MVKKVKGFKCMVIERDKTLGGKYMMEYTDVVLYSCIPETYVML